MEIYVRLQNTKKLIGIVTATQLINIFKNEIIHQINIHSKFTNIISCDQLFELLKMNTTINRVDFMMYDYDNNNNNNNEKNHYCNQLFELLKNNTSIEVLYLAHRNINNDVFGNLINALKVNTTLKHIMIETNSMYCDHVVEILGCNKALFKIHLFIYTVTYNQHNRIINALKNNPYVIDLHLSSIETFSEKNKIKKYCIRNNHNIKLKELMLYDF
jgi:hypothetical protein